MESLGKANIHDKNLLNPWDLVQGPTPFWISDNNAGVSTLYDGAGKIFTVAAGKKKVPFVVHNPRHPTAVPHSQRRLESFSTARLAKFGGDLFVIFDGGWDNFGMAAV